MHRSHLLQALVQYRQRYPEESLCIDHLTSFVQTYANCFERSLHLGHVTGSAWLVNEPGTHVLLTHHRKLNIWVQLGGHADGEADIRKVARREAQEESGLAQIASVTEAIFDVDIHTIPARGLEPEHAHYDVRYAFRAVGSERFTVSEESHALAWIDVAQMATYTTEASMQRMARKWLQEYR